MVYLYGLIIVALGSFLWRVRGGLRFNGEQLPVNKIWYSLYVAVILFIGTDYNWTNLFLGFAASYTSYQLYGWGKYIGALCSGNLDKEEKECELIDDILDPCRISANGRVMWLNDYPYIYGFLGTCLTGLIISFIVGLSFQSFMIIVSGLTMGLSYGLTTWVCKLLGKDEGKTAWNWSEWCDGAVKGLFFAMWLLT